MRWLHDMGMVGSNASIRILDGVQHCLVERRSPRLHENAGNSNPYCVVSGSILQYHPVEKFLNLRIYRLYTSGIDGVGRRLHRRSKTRPQR